MLAAGAVSACGSGPGPEVTTSSALPLTAVLSADEAQFTAVIEPRTLRFPEDHGPHPDHRTEWWYFTGNVSSSSGSDFGFELSFFRFALGQPAVMRSSAWAADQVWMAHLAVSDVDGKKFIAEERFARDTLGLAGAASEPFRVWLLDWRTESPSAALNPLHLRAAGDAVGLDLTLSEPKGPIVHGEQGFDRKGAEPGAASYYYSMPRWTVAGRLRFGDREEVVQGLAWLDREWSSGALSPELEGWDWFGLQLDDGRDLMLYRLRRRDGTASPFSGGSLIGPDGAVQRLAAGDIEFTVLRRWRSPSSGVLYPVAWRVGIADAGLNLEVNPRLDDQELDLSVRYWEGAVELEGWSRGVRIGGVGYLELAGY